MAGEPIHVRRLRIEARRRSSPLALGARLEDALRCASLPGGWRGRIVLIRRLRLRADARMSSQQLSRQIEARWQAAAAAAVPAARAPAHSEAVWFDDEPAARLLLIERLARGADVSAWYWQRLLPKCVEAAVEARIATVWAAPWQSAMAAGERLRFAADVFRAIGEPDLIARVLQRLDEAALERLLPDVVVTTARSDGTVDIAVPLEAALWRRPPSALQEAGRGLPARLDNASPQRRAAMRFAVAVLAGYVKWPATAASPAGEGAAARAVHAAAMRTGAPVRPAMPSMLPAMPAPGLASRWAGFFFVLNLWQRAQCAPASCAQALDWLRALAQRLRVADDGLLPALAALEAPAQEASAPLPWMELRRASLSLTRLPLRRVLARPGRIDLTRTHLTMFLPLRTVDLRIRRAGLDLDPGWSPLLGRIVGFEYD